MVAGGALLSGVARQLRVKAMTKDIPMSERKRVERGVTCGDVLVLLQICDSPNFS